MNIDKFTNYFCSLESIYILGLIVVSIINLILLSDYPVYLLIVNIIAIITYFVISQRKDKKILLIAVIHFAIWGVIIESFIIKQTNFTLKYKTKTKYDFLYVPSWLFTIYIIFMISGLYTFNCFKLLLSN